MSHPIPSETIQYESSVDALRQELATEKRLRKDSEKEAKRLNRQHFAYRDIQAIYSRLKFDAEHDAQAPIDEHYREALYLARDVASALSEVLETSPEIDGAVHPKGSSARERARAKLKRLEALEYPRPRLITVIIEGGIVQDVTGIPSGYELHVEDHDDGDTSHPSWNEGKQCFITIFDGDEA
jgi:hypothetical protein